VIGIRMVAEWFVPEIGLAEGIYGGQRWLCDCWTPLAAATAFLAVGQINWFDRPDWDGCCCLWSNLFFSVQDTPPGKVYERSASSKGLEVTTSKDFWFMLLMNIPLIGILV